MVRLKLFRILLPALLVLAGVLLWMSWVPRSAVREASSETTPREGPRYEDVSFKKVEGSEANVAGDAEVFEPGAADSLHVEGIRKLEIPRSARGPIVVSAERGDREGGPGARRWRFAGQVVSELRDEGLVLRLPSLDVDEAAGVARSQGKIDFEAPGLRGTTMAMTYGLEGQPGELGSIELLEAGGGGLTADRAMLHDGVHDIELIGNVRLVQPIGDLAAERVRLARPEDRLRHLVATGSVAGRWRLATEGANLEGDRLDVFWDADGDIERWQLEGSARLRQADRTLEARRVDARANERGWDVRAEGEVVVRGVLAGDPGVLTTESLDLVVDAALELRSGEARGKASFEGPEFRAQADHATFAVEGGAGEVVLQGVDGYPARLSRERTRVAARSIRSDLRGHRLLAEGRVESTLLSTVSSGGIQRMFGPDQAVHFVSDRLESEDDGNRLTFTGAVRGWQGERNLSGDRVIVDQKSETLEALGSVTSRLPRGSDARRLAETDFVQISADELLFENARGTGRYRGRVRLRIEEGWLEAEQVEIDLTDERRIREIRAMGQARVEIEADQEARDVPLTGAADRLVYSPEESTVRLFGDQTPAMVRRSGEGGGTTTGRVLRYRLDTKTLEVESGDLGSARIRTSRP